MKIMENMINIIFIKCLPVKSLINSIRFNKLIVYDDISLEYLLEIVKSGV